MTAHTLARIFVALRLELGVRAAGALASENVSPWNTEWEIDGRFLDAAQRQCDEFRDVVRDLRDLAVAS